MKWPGDRTNTVASLSPYLNQTEGCKHGRHHEVARRQNERKVMIMDLDGGGGKGNSLHESTWDQEHSKKRAQECSPKLAAELPSKLLPHQEAILLPNLS
eukprot:scaffold6477_cov23-Tisochrysis_lutea.AAC.4